MPIIIEGVDGSGKSHLFEQLIQIFKPERTHHFTQHDGKLPEHKNFMIVKYAESLPYFEEIWDRAWPSCQPYDIYFYKRDDLHQAQVGQYIQSIIKPLLLTRRTLIILCDPGIDTVLDNISGREELVENDVDICAIHRWYARNLRPNNTAPYNNLKFFIPIVTYNYQKETVGGLLFKLIHILGASYVPR